MLLNFETRLTEEILTQAAFLLRLFRKRNTWNKYSGSPKSFLICHHYSSYSCSSSYSTLRGGILFQFYLLPKMLHSIYYSSIPPLPILGNYQEECSLRLRHLMSKHQRYRHVVAKIEWVLCCQGLVHFCLPALITLSILVPFSKIRCQNLSQRYFYDNLFIHLVSKLSNTLTQMYTFLGHPVLNMLFMGKCRNGTCSAV